MHELGTRAERPSPGGGSSPPGRLPVTRAPRESKYSVTSPGRGPSGTPMTLHLTVAREDAGRSCQQRAHREALGLLARGQAVCSDRWSRYPRRRASSRTCGGARCRMRRLPSRSAPDPGRWRPRSGRASPPAVAALSRRSPSRRSRCSLPDAVAARRGRRQEQADEQDGNVPGTRGSLNQSLHANSLAPRVRAGDCPAAASRVRPTRFMRRPRPRGRSALGSTPPTGPRHFGEPRVLFGRLEPAAADRGYPTRVW
jgi:hypothetical protein